MSAEQINEIALMSAEDKNVAVAPIVKKVRKVKKPDVVCCACNEWFVQGRETITDTYGDEWCYDCYDDEYIKCIMCDTECPLDKEDEEWFDRDGDCYCEDCKDEYDEEENKYKQDQRREWVDAYNKSLPQVKQYDENAEAEISYAVNGIYDSELMNYVYSGIESKRIKEIKKIQRGECFRG
jgi:hypothetical protein